MIRKSLLAIVLICGCLPPDGGRPVPDDDWNPGGDAAIREVLEDYRAGLKRVFETTARKLERGDLEGEKETGEFFQKEATQVRLDAFRGFNEVLSERLGHEKWDDQKAARFFRSEGDAL